MNTVLKKPEPVESPSTYEQVEAYWLLVSAASYCILRGMTEEFSFIGSLRHSVLLSMPPLTAWRETSDEERGRAIHERHVYIARLEARKP